MTRRRDDIDLISLARPQVGEAKRILRTCVHCGFCLATCPTYLLLGDERDSPRGRIRLIKDMLETPGGAPAAATVRHVDRCLSCLSCTTTCPSGVNYMHLVDHARTHIERNHTRSPVERIFRRCLSLVLPHPRRFRLMLAAAMMARPLRAVLPAALGRLVAMAPRRLEPSSWADAPGVHRPTGARRLRVALLNGCAQKVLAPRINEATIRLLTGLGCDVTVVSGGGCCGALVHHMGDREGARRAARANIRAWTSSGPFDAIVANASGCGTHLKDYGHLLADDPDWAERAAHVAAAARDVCEVAGELMGAGPGTKRDAPPVACHVPCSLQHGQKLASAPLEILRRAGFEVREIPEGHICCGSAGTYNILQPALADRLLERKRAHIESTGAGIVAAGNIGCIVQIASAVDMPVVHPVELLDWASGGPRPADLP